MTFAYSGTWWKSSFKCGYRFFFSQIATSISTKMILRECVEYHAQLLVVHNTLKNHMSPLLTIILAITLSFRVKKWVLSVPPPKKGILYPASAPDTYLFTPWCRVLLEKLTGLQLVKKFPAFHGTRRFITAPTSIRHLSLSWARPIQSIYPHPTSWRSILILSTHLRLSLLSGLFPSSFPTKTQYTPLSSPIRATCPTHLILIDFITRTILGEEYKSFSSSLCSLLHSLVTASLLLVFEN